MGRYLIGSNGNLIITQVAYEYDLLPYQACVDADQENNGKYKILYFDGNQDKAFLYSNPMHGINNIQPQRKLKSLTKEEIRARYPRYEGIITCNHRRSVQH